MRVRVTETLGEKEREKERIFHVLIHSPSSCSAQGWAGPNRKPEDYLDLPFAWLLPKHRVIFPWFLRLLACSWIESRVSERGTSTRAGCQHGCCTCYITVSAPGVLALQHIQLILYHVFISFPYRQSIKIIFLNQTKLYWIGTLTSGFLQLIQFWENLVWSIIS